PHTPHDPHATHATHDPHAPHVPHARQAPAAGRPAPDPAHAHAHAGDAGTATGAGAGAGGTTVTQRIAVSAVLMNVCHTDLDEASPGEIGSTLCSAEDVVGRVVEQFGGTVMASIGSVSLALFGVYGPRHDDPERAVRAALALRDRFAAEQGPSLRAVVTTGQVLVRLRPGTGGARALSAVGSVLDDGRTLLTQVPDGEVWMSGATRRATGTCVVPRPAGTAPDTWQAVELARPETGSVPDRAYELGVLNGLLDWARNRSVPHLVTVLGAPGVGKTHLLREFGRSIARQPAATARILVARGPSPQGGTPSMPGQILAEYCGILPGETARVIREKLTAALWRLPVAEERRTRLRRTLLPLLTTPTPTPPAPGPGPAPGPVPGPGPASGPGAAGRGTGTAGTGAGTGPVALSETGAGGNPEVLAVWSEFLSVAAALEPLVIVLDDVHLADDALLDRLEQLADNAGTAPLIVVATAGPELLERRPGWGGGRRRVSTLTLLPPAGHPPATPPPPRTAALAGTPGA
ncbi:AAA family ATPase, partial [Streptomyces griseus]